MQEFSRCEPILGANFFNKLSKKSVLIFGLGGVGGYALEALARTGIGSFILVDGDTVEISNFNRQLIAVRSNLGKTKVSAFKERILDINPKIKVLTYNNFILPDSLIFTQIFNENSIDFVVDAVDTISLKIGLAEICEKKDLPLISALGTGNRLIADFQFSDIYKTSACPLAKIMRKELKARGVKALEVLYSPEPVSLKLRPPASVAWVPSIAGLMLAERVVNKLIAL